MSNQSTENVHKHFKSEDSFTERDWTFFQPLGSTEADIEAQEATLGHKYFTLHLSPLQKEPEDIDQAKAKLHDQDTSEVVVLTQTTAKSTDFTLVEHLFITGNYRPMVDFIEAGLAKDLKNAESLLIDIREIDEVAKTLFSDALLQVFHNLRSLQSLVIREEEFQSSLPIATICRTGTTLRSLEIGGESRGRGRDPVSLNDLKELSEYCPNLENLNSYLPMFPYRDVAGYVNRLTFEAEELAGASSSV